MLKGNGRLFVFLLSLGTAHGVISLDICLFCSIIDIRFGIAHTACVTGSGQFDRDNFVGDAMKLRGPRGAKI